MKKLDVYKRKDGETHKYLSNQKLWRIVKERDEYYYEIKLAGGIVDRIKVEEPAISYFKDKGVI